MRRLLASLLLLLLGVPLTPLFLLQANADAESKLPACCRRDGKHKCAMDQSAHSSGVNVESVRTRCANFPIGHSFMAIDAFLTAPAFAVSAPLAAIMAPAAQAEAQYRVSFSRTRQKRGPPAIFS